MGAICLGSVDTVAGMSPSIIRHFPPYCGRSSRIRRQESRNGAATGGWAFSIWAAFEARSRVFASSETLRVFLPIKKKKTKKPASLFLRPPQLEAFYVPFNCWLPPAPPLTSSLWPFLFINSFFVLCLLSHLFSCWPNRHSVLKNNGPFQRNASVPALTVQSVVGTKTEVHFDSIYNRGDNSKLLIKCQLKS